MNAITRFKNELALNLLRRARERVMRERLNQPANETDAALAALRGLMPADLSLSELDKRMAERVRQAAVFEAAAIPTEVMQTFVKMGATSAVSAEDLARLQDRGYRIAPFGKVNR